MSWLGKILTFLVLIAALVWAYFTVSVYATRTNWKVRADAYEKALKLSEANRDAELTSTRAEKEQLVRQLETEKIRTAELSNKYDELAALSKKGDDDFKAVTATLRATAAIASQKDASEKVTLSELTDTRKRNAELEDKLVKVTLEKETGARERLRAENDSKLQRSVAEENAKKILELTDLVAQLRQTGGSGTAAVLRSIEKTPAPLPDNTRGTVLRDATNEFVQISIGIDAGLEPGSRLDVYRESGGGQYLGTLVVTKSLYPKQAVAEFRPARRVPVAQLRADELPRKGDTVGIISTSASKLP
ncbi:Uncharacterized protein OS=Blastopirellula marina DSM 3645 GN=DSM3645_09607 PE=4 SV=1 [Gemmata massiliana]|uniref:Chromosome partition protein Smc n=1 Tax=Gemmata massiliana TaxID=1210884 RepID=A0A6P2CQ00_9BACT|nr:hypothetical protein [Gemmata massiliana]VTR91021.1 Uncharacterized protein OS=Blastopirellula marina DSM 3645 GN=DSM3645_09607 PE=4 SV=1 [Gemmata massiliana]